MKVFVGTFNASDIESGRDKLEIAKAKELHNLNYTETQLIKRGSKYVGMKVWVCDAETFSLAI